MRKISPTGFVIALLVGTGWLLAGCLASGPAAQTGDSQAEASPAATAAGSTGSGLLGGLAGPLIPGSQIKLSDPIALAYDPGSSSLLKGDTAGLWRWQNGMWQKLTLPQEGAVSGVVVNPKPPARLYVTGPTFGVLRSDDNGQTWQALNRGLPSLTVTMLTRHSRQPETLYTWVQDVGIYQTEDGGANWKKALNPGLPDPHVRSLVHAFLPGDETGFYATTPSGAYWTLDCFCGWQALTTLPGQPAMHGLAADPLQPKRLYVAGPAGLFRSDDAGQTWSQVGQELAGEPLGLALNPASTGHIFTVLADGATWESKDGATTWQRLTAEY